MEDLESGHQVHPSSNLLTLDIARNYKAFSDICQIVGSHIKGWLSAPLQPRYVIQTDKEGVLFSILEKKTIFRMINHRPDHVFFPLYIGLSVHPHVC